MADAISDDIADISRAGLIDAPFYLTANPDVAAAGIEPAVHFCTYGWGEGRAPNPYFDPGWYLAANPDVRRAALNPLAHYLRHGEREGRHPGPWFNPFWYGNVHNLLPGDSSLGHFLANRILAPVCPMPELYAVPHLAAYRNAHSAGADPFHRYIIDVQHGRSVLPPDETALQDAGLIDANAYMIRGPDVHDADQDPVAHFCRYGWREQRDPNPYFATSWYLRTNPEVARLGVNPLVHYLFVGEPADRRPVVYFNPAWYRQKYGIGNKSALAHYLAHRRSQLFSPTPGFDVGWYLARHGKAVGPNRDPFAHYLLAGTQADIDPSAEFNAALYRRRYLGRRSRHFASLLHFDRDNALIHALHQSYG